MKVLVVTDCDIKQQLYKLISHVVGFDLILTGLPSLEQQLETESCDVVVIDGPYAAIQNIIGLVGQHGAGAPVIAVVEELDTTTRADATLVREDVQEFCPELRQTLERLVIDAAVGKVLRATVAKFNHEINNPLTVILGTAELLLETHSDLPVAVQEGLRRIVEHACRLGRFNRAIANLPEEIELEEKAGITVLKVPGYDNP